MQAHHQQLSALPTGNSAPFYLSTIYVYRIDF